MPGLVCLGDDRPPRSSLTGWFAKIEVFAPWNRDLRPCLFFDLDTFVIGDLEPFNRIDLTQFWLINDFGHPERGESGLFIAPDHPIADSIWAGHENAMAHRSDGAYFRQFPHQRLNRAVSGIYSYKWHCRERIPDDARIICFHGRPRPHEAPGWVRTHWNSLTKNS